MANLKQAYDNFMAALEEETGLKPNIAIRIHTHTDDNAVGKYPPVAAGVSYHIANALGLPTPKLFKSDESPLEWFNTDSFDKRTEFTLFM